MASSRRVAARTLDRLVLVHTLLGNEHKARAFKNASWPVRSMEGELEDLLAQGALERRRGFGPAVMEVLRAAVAGEPLPGLADLEAQVPPGLFEVARVRGLGAKRVRQLHQQLGVTDLSELALACAENRLAGLDGFGRKTQDRVQAEVQRLVSERGKFRRDQALELASTLVEALRRDCERVMVVGDTRRGCELVTRVELLVVGEGQPPPLDSPIPVTVHRCGRDDWGTQAVRLTGSEGHLARLGELPICSSEAEVYRRLGWVLPAPERRQDHVELLRAGSPPPELVRREDLRGSLHNHSTSSDGADSLEAMRDAALAAGLSYLGVTEHSQTAGYARGLEPERLRQQGEQIRALNAQGHGCVLLAGVESDILREGELDYTPSELGALDLVVASIHDRFGLDAAATTRRMTAAAANPWVSVMGHPTGRLLLGRPPAEYDVEAMLDAAALNGCAVELNCSPHRLDLNERHLELAAERGLLVSIAADAHSAHELGFLDYGVSIARRAGLRPDQVLNALPLAELMRWLAARRDRARALSA